MKTSAAHKPRHTFDRTAPLSTRYYTTSKLSENIHETPEGYLLCIGVPLAGIGEMEYGHGETPLEVGDDGKVIVTRTPDVLFAPETVASFEGKAVTIRHPQDFLNPSNWGKLANGIMQNVRRGEGKHETDLLADLLITAAEAIALVKRGLREVSLGYDAWYVQTGIGRGVQTKIIGNHLALVEEGRAGAGYAITDHKGKGSAMKMKDRIKAIFAKAQDEALKVADETDETEEVEETTGDIKSLAKTVDGLSRVVVKLNDKIDRVVKGKSKDASTPPTESKPAKVKAEDDETGLADRLTVLEGKVEKLLAMLSDKAEDDDTESDEETDDETCEDDDGDDDEVTDGDYGDDDEPKKKTGDSRRTGPKESDEDDEDEELAARVEILAPGMSARSKNVKVKALLAAYGTKDGKAVIHQFTNGKKLDVKNSKFVNTVFIAASEVLKSKRTRDFASTRTSDFNSNMGQPKGAMTPEEINERNAKHYGPKTTH